VRVETQMDCPTQDFGLWQVRAISESGQTALRLMQVRRACDRRGQALSHGQQEQLLVYGSRHRPGDVGLVLRRHSSDFAKVFTVKGFLQGSHESTTLARGRGWRGWWLLLYALTKQHDIRPLVACPHLNHAPRAEAETITPAVQLDLELPDRPAHPDQPSRGDLVTADQAAEKPVIFHSRLLV
jgi:hypothetical protein